MTTRPTRCLFPQLTAGSPRSGSPPACVRWWPSWASPRRRPVQARAIPLLLAGRDLIGQSSTGSGKTAAFGLAILQKLKRGERRPQALILCPTRELCAQVARELRKLGRREAGLAVLILSGGQPMKPQLAALQRGVHVVVGTPGRALDHIVRGSLDLSGVATVVVDEADRMLEMGFGAEMEKILSGAPKPRQTVFFSATYPRSIDAMTKAHQHDPERLTVGEADGPRALSRQLAYVVDDRTTTPARARCWRSCATSPPESAPSSSAISRRPWPGSSRRSARRGSAAPACTATWNRESATS